MLNAWRRRRDGGEREVNIEEGESVLGSISYPLGIDTKR
jgi:hypothetical protein